MTSISRQSSFSDRSPDPDEDLYAFLLIHGEATLRFDMPVKDAVEMSRTIDEGMRSSLSWLSDAERRASLREKIRTGVLDNEHLDPDLCQHMAQLLVHFLLTSPASQQAPDCRGLILEIQDKGGGDSNFRTKICSDRDYVDEICATIRQKARTIVKFDPAARRKAKVKPPRDPSLSPPPHPRPDKFLPALQEAEDNFGANHFRDARLCLTEAPRFVFRSRQLAEGSLDEIDASLAAMAEFGRLKLPHDHIWLETRDHIEHWAAEGKQYVPALIGVAAWQQDENTIAFHGFADISDRRVISAFVGRIECDQFREDYRPLTLELPPIPAGHSYNEVAMRAVSRAAADRLLELLFLLSTSGIAVERISSSTRSGNRSGGSAKGGSSRKKRREWDQGYTIVRVPLSWIPKEKDTRTSVDPGGAGSIPGSVLPTGRWVRPHVRRAHMWGKNTRPVTEQRWVEATLVGASRLADDEKPATPIYLV